MFELICLQASDFIALLHDWQELGGAMIGAFGAFFVWWHSERVKRKSEWEENLKFLDRILVSRINSLCDAAQTLSTFADTRLQFAIDKLVPDGKYSMGKVFLPFFEVQPIDRKVLEASTDSGFVDSSILQAYNLSEDFSHVLADSRYQLDSTFQMPR